MIRSLPLSLGVLALAATPAWSQGFDSGSDGSDGALTFPAGATVDFDPQALGIDPDQDNVFHFSSITIPNGTTVRVRSSQLGGQGKPVVWLAQGVVSIAGTLDLSGATGQGGFVIPASPKRALAGSTVARVEPRRLSPAAGRGRVGAGPASAGRLAERPATGWRAPTETCPAPPTATSSCFRSRVDPAGAAAWCSTGRRAAAVQAAERS